MRQTERSTPPTLLQHQLLPLGGQQENKVEEEEEKEEEEEEVVVVFLYVRPCEDIYMPW